MRKKPPLTVYIGPTASGKTDAAIAYAEQHNGAIVSADSRQVYTGMDIGTAKPKQAWNASTHQPEVAEDIEGVPHYLLNIRKPNDPLTLADWQAMAYQVIDTIVDSGRKPILTGGTMLYVDSIVRGYSIPNVPANKQLRASLEKLPLQELTAKLKAQDPKALDFIEPHNKRRIIRALEVMQATGEKFSFIRATQEPHYECVVIGLFPGWGVLEQRITKRIHNMLADGLPHEIQALQKIYGKELPLLKTLDYKEVIEFLNNECTKEEAVHNMIRANMRYAHRQMSWWRGRKDINWTT